MLAGVPLPEARRDQVPRDIGGGKRRWFLYSVRRLLEEGRLLGVCGVKRRFALLGCMAGRAWRTTHRAPGERKWLLLYGRAKHVATEDDIGRDTNER
jgi:hypothetical protein